jgi:hypothetical protein
VKVVPACLPAPQGSIRAWLATMARAEHAARVTHYPAQVEAGEIERGDAADDIAAWDAIARLFAEGSVETELPWGALELAAARALRRREDACLASPASEALRRRRDAVQAIHDRIVWTRNHWTGAPTPAAKAEAA